MLGLKIEDGGAIYECQDVSHIERPPRDQQGPRCTVGNQVTVMVVPLAEENSLFRVSNHVVEDLRVEEEVVVAGRHSHHHLDNPYNFRLMSVYGHPNIKFSSKEPL